MSPHPSKNNHLHEQRAYKLISLNIEMEQHIEVVEHLVRTERPDFLFFQEISRHRFELWLNRLMPHGIYTPMVSSVSQPFGEWGLAIMATSEIIDRTEVVYDGFSEDYPEFRGSRSERPMATVLTAQVAALPGIALATTHFTWSMGGLVTSEQRVNVERLLTALRPYPQVVLGGDFNTPRGKEIYARLAEEMKDCIPAEWSTTLDPYLHRAAPLSLVVDGLFSRGEVKVDRVRAQEGVSDHMAIVAELRSLKS